MAGRFAEWLDATGHPELRVADTGEDIARRAREVVQTAPPLPEVLEDLAGRLGEETSTLARRAEQLAQDAAPAAAAAAQEVSSRIQPPRPVRRVRRVRFAARLVAAVLGWMVLYRRWLGPWIRRWGATDEETSASLPGDGLVSAPRSTSTRAISIQASAEEVWPWLLQLGQGRGGLYSYDRLENLFGCDIHSVDRLVPELQGLSEGDVVRLVPPDYPADLHFEVNRIEPGRALVLVTPGSPEENLPKGLPYASWAFVLRSPEPGRSRLVVRWRSTYSDARLSRFANGWGIELPHFVMERGMMQGIRARAEGRLGREAGGD